MNNFKQNLRHLLRRFGITQFDLAVRLGKAQNTISNWIRGHSHPDLPDLLQISQYFGITLDNLITADLEKTQLITDAHIEELKIKGGVKGSRKYRQTSGDKELWYKESGMNSIVSDTEVVGTWVILTQLKSMDQKLDKLLEKKLPESKKNKDQ